MISRLLLPSAVRLATYSCVRRSRPIRARQIMYSARLASRLPPRLRRCRTILPEEILALQSEYFNMTDFERVYDLYAQESKDRVSEQVFVGAEKEAKQQGVSPTTPTSYSIPSVQIEGDRATIHVVAVEPPVEGEGLHRDRVVTYAHEAELVLKDEGWRIMMQKAALRHYKCWETEGRLC